jgi:hypothetical protein
MTTQPGAPLEDQIAQWREYLRRRRAIDGQDVQELESHLRDQMAALTTAGLAGDEAFLVAVKRMGSLDALSREFAREHSERLWKQLVIASDGVQGDDVQHGRLSTRTDARVAIGLGVLAGAAIKAPALFGYDITNGFKEPFYAHNMSLFVLPLLTLYFAWKRGLQPSHGIWLALPFIAGAAFVNSYPFTTGSNTSVLAALHLPIALWITMGLAYVRMQWFDGDGRMNFVRFTGELAIYYALIGLGGVVLIAFTVMMFDAIHMKPDTFIGGWLVPCGAMGAVLVAAWLVEAKQSVIENMAPVLTRLFTPLFVVLLLAFLIIMAWTRSPLDIERGMLIGFDLLLVLVVGLVLYSASARDPHSPPDNFDRLQLVLVLSALAVDALTLAAIAARISDLGFTPNRVAAFGENIILLANLAWTAWLYVRFIRRRTRFAELERWQMNYLPIYSAWAAFVVIAFPPLFQFM